MLSILRKRGITFKLIFFILTSCTIIFVAIFSYNYGVSRGIIIEKIEENAGNLTLSTVSKIETILLPIEKVPEHLAVSLETLSYDKDEIDGMLRRIIERNPNIYGTTVAFAPYEFEKDSHLFAPYCYRKDGRATFADLGTDSYNYPEWDWYKVPKELGRPVWSEPYFDRGGGNVIMSTYSVPFYRNIDGKKTFMGVVTADISLAWLHDIVSGIKIEETGYAALISANGTIITHPDTKLIMKDTIFGIAKKEDNPRLAKIGKEMVSGGSGFSHIKSTVTGKDSWMSFAPVPATGWSLAILFPKKEMMQGITNLNRAVFALGIVGILFLILVIALIANSITHPLRTLAVRTKEIATGNLDFELPALDSEDEVGSLTKAFIYMKQALKDYISKLTRATSEKQKMESELKIAHDIQMGILRKDFPPFPDRKEFDVFATLKPAKEVGGDFYDFFLVDEDHLCFTAGDVSGKGVPAAFFMALVKTFIKTVAKVVKEPDKILDYLNREILRDNVSWMFVTVYFGVLDLRTGEIFFANGGHNPPLVVKSGSVEYLEEETGVMIGAFEEAAFKKERLVLKEGDTLLLYTDGVTEAFNRNNEEFSDERLKALVAGHRYDGIKGLVALIMDEVGSFSSGMLQSDDITIMAVRYFGNTAAGKGSGEQEIVLKNDYPEIRRLADKVTVFGKQNGLSLDTIDDVNLAMEEIINNIIKYAYDDKDEHEIKVGLKKEEDVLSVEILDDGRPFDPLKVEEPDTERPLREREPGGLGIHFVRNMMDSMEYRRSGEQNILVMKKDLK